MSDIIITEEQLKLIRKKVNQNESSEKKELVNEAWYNTVMEVIGLVDPTPITDTINAVSYFSQGNTLFGVLSLISAVPFYVGDFVAKPVMGALKIGAKETKQLNAALELSSKGTKEAIDQSADIIQKLAKEPGPVGNLLRRAGGPNGWAGKVNKFINEIPAGPFKGMKNTIMDYFTLLGRAGTKSEGVSGLAKSLEADLRMGKVTVKDIQALKDLVKNTKVIDVASLSKPGMFRQVFFGGIPRLFRSPEGRRVRILMQQTKWWLGFLDYIGFGNWVGEEEVIKKLGSEAEYQKSLEAYQKTPEAKKYFDESLGTAENVASTTSTPPPPQQTQQQPKEDSIAKLLKDMLIGRLNPLPGM